MLDVLARVEAKSEQRTRTTTVAFILKQSTRKKDQKAQLFILFNRFSRAHHQHSHKDKRERNKVQRVLRMGYAL